MALSWRSRRCHLLSVWRQERALLLLNIIPRSVKRASRKSGISQRQLVRLFEGEGQNYLDEVEKLLEKVTVPVRTAVISGEPSEVIAALADRSHSSYIVMSTHARVGLERWAIGSVTQGVLQLTTRPIILTRPSEDHARLQPAFS